MLSNIISFVASKFADKAINAGIDAVLEDDSGGGGNIVSPPNFDAARILASSPAGVGDLTFGKLEFEENSYEENLQDWEKRLVEYAQSRPIVSKMEV
jgi:hypothetical protein